MGNPTELGRAGPTRISRQRAGRIHFGAFAALAALVVACTESDKKPVTGPETVSGPSYGLTDPFNAGDKCLAADAFLSGFTSGVSDSLKLADPKKSCTANDIRIANAIVDSISTDGVNYVKFTGQNTQCNEGDPLFLQMAARVDETSTSQRTDIGIWIGLSGSNGRTGRCNQYNLTDQGIPTGGVSGGVSNIDGDQCGDMNNGDSTLVQLGKVQVLCQAATAQDTLVHVGSCLAWTVPGSDQVCPRAPGDANGFRWATTPSSTSKCNCEGFNVPITVARHAFLEVVKACSPSQIPGATFDLLIDGSNSHADNVGCAGTTGKQQVTAGTSSNPGAVHTHGEGDFGGGFTGTDYTSSFSCVNRGTSTSRGSGTSRGPNNITLQPNDDVVCTYTNVLQPKVKLVKTLDPTSDAGKFDFTLAGTSFDNGGAGYGNGGTTDFQTVSIGSVSFSEAAHNGTSLGDYVSSVSCLNAANGSVTVNPNNNTSGTISVAAGDRITCTFVNHRKPQVSLVKKIIPTTDAGKFDFTLAGTAFNNSGAGYGNNGTTGFQNVSAGSVSFSEAGHTGTTLSDYTTALECRNAADVVVGSNPNGTNTAGSVTVTYGDKITCTFTNTKGAVLKLVKTLDPTTDGGKFDFTIAGASFTNGGVGYGNTGTTNFQPVALGSVSFSETAHTGTSLTNYTTDLSCVNAESQTVPANPTSGNTGGSVTVAAGDQITCTFVNHRKPQVKLVKLFNPTGDAGRVDFTLAGTSFTNGGAGYAHNGTTDFQNVTVGTVSFSESGHTGTALTDFSTTLGCQNAASVAVAANPTAGNTAGSVTVAAGDQITCTFTNTRIPLLKLVKTINPTNDPGTFDLTIAGNTFTNNGAGYSNNGTTGFQQVAIGSVSFSEAGHGTTVLTQYASSLECRNAANVVIASNPNATNTAGSVTTVAGSQITCTFLNNHAPHMTITKTPDYPNGGSVSPGQTATFTVTVSAGSDGGPGLNVVVTDTLPANVGDWTENPDKAECTITALSGETAKRLLVCNVGTVNPGSSYTVVVQATVPSNILQTPPDPNGPTAPIEIDGNLVDDAGGGKDWGTPGLISCSNPVKGCDIDLPTGTSDNSFGGGTSEDDAVPKVVTGSIPNNKSDLLRFYVANERINVSQSPLTAHDFLYLAWERVQNPSGTTNMDFELNQSTQLSSNGVTPVRTAGDILIKYDLSQGGTTPTLGFHRWVTTGACEKKNAPPCWGPVISLAGNPNVAAAINAVTVTDPIAPNAGRNVDPFTFGEARIDLQATGIFDPNVCESFGRAYLKSRSSDSFTSEIKDFIAPIPVSVNNCAPVDLPNRAWVAGSNFSPISDTGLIHVSDASALTTPTTLRLAQLPASETFVVPEAGQDVIPGARERSGTPWPAPMGSDGAARRRVAGRVNNAPPGRRMQA